MKSVKLDNIISESISSYVKNIINEDSEGLTGYDISTNPRSVLLNALRNGEGTIENNDNLLPNGDVITVHTSKYVFDIEYDSVTTTAHWERGMRSMDYDVPDDPDELVDGECEIYFDTIKYYDAETDEELGEIEIDDELKEAIYNVCDFDAFNQEYADSADDYEDWMKEM